MSVYSVETVALLFLIVLKINSLMCENITIGYITGSEKPEDQFYRRPGQAISGALTLALKEINSREDILPNDKLQFLIAETRGKEFTSIRSTVELIYKNISVYIGPQESCIHEGKIAAAFNIPMISYVSSKLKYHFVRHAKAASCIFL